SPPSAPPGERVPSRDRPSAQRAAPPERGLRWHRSGGAVEKGDGHATPRNSLPEEPAPPHATQPATRSSVAPAAGGPPRPVREPPSSWRRPTTSVYGWLSPDTAHARPARARSPFWPAGGPDRRAGVRNRAAHIPRTAIKGCVRVAGY